MVIDDSIHQRADSYRDVLTTSDFELVIVKSAEELEQCFSTTPVDGYLVDVILNTGSWQKYGNAGSLFSRLGPPPRRAPVFLVSMNWGEPETIQTLNTINQIRDLEVLRYLVWPDFIKAGRLDNNPDLVALRGKLFDDLSIWHQRSSFRPEDDENIRILILADLQYGDPHTSSNAAFSEQWVSRVLRKDDLMPDILIIAGDIGFSGTATEYREAKKRLEENLLNELWAASALDNMRERVLMVPGNHDVNLRYLACNGYKWERDKMKWALLEPSTQDKKVADDTFSLEAFRQFAVATNGSKAWDDGEVSSHLDRRFEGCGLRFYLLNSSRYTSLNNPKRVEFGSEDLEAISRSLGSSDNPKDFINIVVSHHGIQTGASSEQIADWENVGKQFFMMNHVGIWVFGHYHKEKFSVEDIGSNKLNLVQAPTLRIAPGESICRGFTLIDMKRTDGVVVGGEVRFYRLDASGAPLGEPVCNQLVI